MVPATPSIPLSLSKPDNNHTIQFGSALEGPYSGPLTRAKTQSPVVAVRRRAWQPNARQLAIGLLRDLALVRTHRISALVRDQFSLTTIYTRYANLQCFFVNSRLGDTLSNNSNATSPCIPSNLQIVPIKTCHTKNMYSEDI